MSASFRFKYDEELPLVVAMLLVYAIVCFVLSIYFQEQSGANSIWVTKWAYGVFTVSQIVTPLLPIALVVGQTMASKRLRENGVSCLNPKRIAISGKITDALSVSLAISLSASLSLLSLSLAECRY